MMKKTLHIMRDDYYYTINIMNTNKWGPPMWKSLHAISFGYPVKPTHEQKKSYMTFFLSVGDVLPCSFCRVSYKKYIYSHPTILDDSIMASRYTLTKWLFDIHNRINEKLGVTYDVTYKDVVMYYESYRSGNRKGKACGTKKKMIPTSNDKLYVLSQSTVSLAKDYASKRGVAFNTLDYEDENRIETCATYASKMTLIGIDSIDECGPWKGMPSKYECYLIMLGVSRIKEKYLRDLFKR